MYLDFNLDHYSTAATETAINIYFVKRLARKTSLSRIETASQGLSPQKLDRCENNRDEKKCETRD